MADATAGAKLSYIHPGSPQSRGRIVRRAFANPERLDPSQRGMRCSLSLRERARVRGNETQPTQTAGRILQAQLDRLPDSVTRATQKQISRRALRTIGVSRQAHWCFERSFPWGEGEHLLEGSERSLPFVKLPVRQHTRVPGDARWRRGADQKTVCEFAKIG